MQLTSDQRVAIRDNAVTLTDEQKMKIKAICDTKRRSVDLMASGEDRSTLMPKIRAIRTDENDQIKALLTDDKKPKFDANLSCAAAPPAALPP